MPSSVHDHSSLTCMTKPTSKQLTRSCSIIKVVQGGGQVQLSCSSNPVNPTWPTQISHNQANKWFSNPERLWDPLLSWWDQLTIPWMIDKLLVLKRTTLMMNPFWIWSMRSLWRNNKLLLQVANPTVTNSTSKKTKLKTGSIYQGINNLWVLLVLQSCHLSIQLLIIWIWLMILLIHCSSHKDLWIMQVDQDRLEGKPMAMDNPIWLWVFNSIHKLHPCFNKRLMEVLGSMITTGKERGISRTSRECRTKLKKWCLLATSLGRSIISLVLSEWEKAWCSSTRELQTRIMRIAFWRRASSEWILRT